MTSIIEAIRKAHYVASIGQVEQLARTVHEGELGASTYLAVLLVACQSKLGKRGRRPSAESQMAVLDATHAEFYAAVLRGVADSASDEKENRRRGTFARSSASTLRNYIRAGGDLRTLDATTVTKTALYRMVAPPEPGDKLARRWTRTHDSLIRVLNRMVKTNPEFAAESLEIVIEELQALLNDLPEAPGDATIAGSTSVLPGSIRPRGQPPRQGTMLHSPA